MSLRLMPNSQETILCVYLFAMLELSPKTSVTNIDTMRIGFYKNVNPLQTSFQIVLSKECFILFKYLISQMHEAGVNVIV